MNEHRPYSPEREQEETVERTAQSVREFLKVLERAGRKFLKILGPAVLLGGAPAMAAERSEPVSCPDTAGLHCDIAWIDAQGQKVGESTMAIPDVSTMSEGGEHRVETTSRHAGDVRGAVPVGFLTSTESKEKNQAAQTERTDDDKTLLQTARSIVHTVSNDAVTKGLMSGDAYGWTFHPDLTPMLDAKGINNPFLRSHDMAITAAASLQESPDMSIKDIKDLKGNLPKLGGAFVKVTFKPKRG